MTSYLPPYDQLCSLLGVDKEELQQPGLVQVPAEVLLAVIKAAVSGLSIDVPFYRTSNLDVDKAFNKDSLVERHFKETGYFEGRKFPSLVDVDFYERRYSDLAAAAKRGEIPDLKTHFHEVGSLEKRVPSAKAEQGVKSWDQLAKTYGKRSTGGR